MIVRLSFIPLAFVLVLFGADAARADTSRTCVFVETLAELPGDLRQIRQGKGNVDQFRRNLTTTRYRLSDNRSAVLFSAAELFSMRQFLNAVYFDWTEHGTNATSRQPAETAIVSPQSRRDIANIVARYGCDHSTSSDTAPLKGFDAGTISALVVLGVVAALLAIVFIIVKILKFGQRDQRMICRVPAKLQFGGQSYPTQIMNISRGGVMVQAPESEMGDAPVTLGLPSVQITSRVVWTNSNFAGLVFDKKISPQMVDEIAKIKPTPIFPASEAASSSGEVGVSPGQPG